MSGVDLTNADLTRANLSSINLSNSIINDTRITSAVSSNIDLSGAQISGYGLGGLNLNGADLSGANLINANLTNVDITSEILDNIHEIGITYIDSEYSDGLGSKLPEDYSIVEVIFLVQMLISYYEFEGLDHILKLYKILQINLTEVNLTSALVGRYFNGCQLEQCKCYGS